MTEVLEGYEPVEISTAKNIVWDILDTETMEFDGDSESLDLIHIADRVVEALVEAGVYIPQDLEEPEGFYRAAEDVV